MDVEILREQIPATRGMTYMNTGWSGPSPKSVIDAIKDRLAYENQEGPTSPEVSDSGKVIELHLREAVADLLNTSPEEICLTGNTTDGLNMVINGLSWSAGDEIITCNLEHSSVIIPSYYQRHRHGVEVKVVEIGPDDDAETILGKFEGALTDRTRLIFLSHIEYSCGLRMPVKEIRGFTRDRGVMMLLDGAQTAGHIALDMQDIDCDFYSIAGQKWLLGPEGTGALYIRKEMIPQVKPMKVAGRAVVSHETPYEFEPLTDSMDKFLLTSSSAPLRAGMLEALRFIRRVGQEEIEERNHMLGSSMVRALREIPGVTVISPSEGSISCGLVAFHIHGVEPKAAVDHLWEHHRILCRQVSYPACIRTSLHFFNTEEEVDSLVGAVRELA